MCPLMGELENHKTATVDAKSEERGKNAAYRELAK